MAKTLKRGRLLLIALAAVLVVGGIGIGLLLGPSDDASIPAGDPTAESATAIQPSVSPSAPSNTSEPGAHRPLIGCEEFPQTLVFNGSMVTATFDGQPGQPTPFCASDWDIAVHSRDASTFYELEPMLAGHGEDCSPPPDRHQQHGSYEDAVYSCKDHLMTAINASGYGLVYLAPAALLDFSNGEAVLKFDASTFRASGRDWFDIWLTPYEDNLQLPLDDWLPDLQGEPANAIHIRMDGPLGDTKFRANVISNHVATELPSNWGPMEQSLKMDEARRDTFELRISANRIRFGMPAYNRWWIDAPISALGWDTSVVQLGQHAYNPTKDDGGQPGTIHWDNFVMSPAVPFTMVRANYRYADEDGQSVSFIAPAPAGANLRFSAVGHIEVSFDNGQSWQPAIRQAQEREVPEHFSSYWMPIPQGTRTVLFRGEPDLYLSQWLAKDFSIWSQANPTAARPVAYTTTSFTTSTGDPLSLVDCGIPWTN